MPRVSVVMPAYNSAAFLDRTLSSVMRQTYPDFEVIVADDGSRDNTADVVARYAPRVRYLHQPNRGVSAARNLALSAATGELIAHLDSDDVWFPDKLARQVAFLDAHPECGVVHTETATIDDDDNVMRARYNHEDRRLAPEGYCLMTLLRLCHIQVSSTMERRTVFERVGGFDQRLPAAEDYLRWILAAMEGFAFGYIDEPLAQYRIRRGSLFQSRSMAIGYVRLFEMLLGEHRLEERFGTDAAAIARERLWGFRRALAVRDQVGGQHAEARRLALRLIRDQPGDLLMYAVLAKACLPVPFARWLRRIRNPAR